MPTYCYRRLDTGEIVEITMSIQEMIRRQDGTDTIELEDGVRAVRDFSAEHKGSFGMSGWPLLSDAAGVNPQEIDRARQASESLGVPTDFASDGRAIFRDPKHRRDYCRAIGLKDLNNYGGRYDP